MCSEFRRGSALRNGSRCIVAVLRYRLCSPFRLESDQFGVLFRDLAQVHPSNPGSTTAMNDVPEDQIIRVQWKVSVGNPSERVPDPFAKFEKDRTGDETPLIVTHLFGQLQLHQALRSELSPHSQEETQRAWRHNVSLHGGQIDAIPCPQLSFAICGPDSQASLFGLLYSPPEVVAVASISKLKVFVPLRNLQYIGRPPVGLDNTLNAFGGQVASGLNLKANAFCAGLSQCKAQKHCGNIIIARHWPRIRCPRQRSQAPTGLLIADIERQSARVHQRQNAFDVPGFVFACQDCAFCSALCGESIEPIRMMKD